MNALVGTLTGDETVVSEVISRIYLSLQDQKGWAKCASLNVQFSFVRKVVVDYMSFKNASKLGYSTIHYHP